MLRSAYRQDKAAQSLALRSLLDEPAFAFEDREAVFDQRMRKLPGVQVL